MKGDQQGMRRVFAGATAAACLLVGLSLGGVYALAGLALGALVAATYLCLFEHSLLPRRRGRELGLPTRLGGGEALWADAERALRLFDRREREALAPAIDRLARAGRRAIERGRQAPGDQAGARARQLLCTAAEALAAYDRAAPEGRKARQAKMCSLLTEAAAELERGLELETDDRALRTRLRVLERELQTKRGK